MKHSDHGIVRDGKAEEQPADKERARTAPRADPDKSASKEETRDPKLTRSGRGRRKRIGKTARIKETIVDPPGDRGDDDALAGNGLDGSRRSIMLERCDRTIGQKKLVVLTVSDHGRDLVHQEFARLLIIVDLSRTLEIVQSDLNRVFQQERAPSPKQPDMTHPSLHTRRTPGIRGSS